MAIFKFVAVLLIGFGAITFPVTIFSSTCEPPVFPKDNPATEVDVMTVDNVAEIRSLTLLGRGVVTQVAWLESEASFAAVTPIGIWLYDPDTVYSSPCLLENTHENVVAISPDGSIIASFGQDDALHLRTAETGEDLLALPGVTDIRFSPDMTKAVVYLPENPPELWSITEKKKLLDLPSAIRSPGGAAFSVDGKLLAVARSGNTVQLWNLDEYREIAVFEGGASALSSVALSPDGELLAAGGYTVTGGTRQPGHLQLWNIKTGKEIAQWEAHRNDVPHVLFSPDGNLLASAGWDGIIYIWDTHQKDTAPVERHTLDDRRSFYNTDLVFSGDGTHLMATSLNGVVNIWNVNTGMKETMITEHPGFVIGLAFHPQGNSIASASFDGIGRLWDINDGYIQTSIDEFETLLGDVAFSPDGSLVAFSDYWKFFLWDTIQNRAGIAPTEGHIGDINTLVFSPGVRNWLPVAMTMIYGYGM